MELTHEWKTQSGLKVIATCELKLKETIFADGHNVEVDRCDKSFDISIEGMGTVGYYVRRDHLQTLNGDKFVASCGKLVISQENLDAIDKMIDEVEAHPAWVAKQETIARNQKETKENEARRIKNGWCPRCESYCDGDCQAN